MPLDAYSLPPDREEEATAEIMNNRKAENITAAIQPGLALARMRDAAPLVQNITNYVAMNIMANVMLAAGASPAMVHALEEAADFAALADAITINIGTLSPAWLKGMEATAKAAAEQQKTWVLDPVAIGATAYRQIAVAKLLAHKPTIIRGNASEIMALAGLTQHGKGVDSHDAVAAAMEGANKLAQQTGGVVAVSGAHDYVTDGQQGFTIKNGHPLMPRVTALGCSLNGVIAAFAAHADSPIKATIAAMAYYSVAGEIAGNDANGPGSFAVAFLDALANLGPDQVDQQAHIVAA